MKHVLSLLALFVVLGLQAQEQEQVPEKEPERKERRAQRKGRMHNHKEMAAKFTPEQIATIKTKRMALQLDLTDAQQRQVQKLNEEIATERKAKIEARKAEKEKKKELTDDEKFERLNERLDAQLAHQKAMRKILNDEQYELWKSTAAKKGRKKKAMRKRKQRRSK